MEGNQQDEIEWGIIHLKSYLLSTYCMSGSVLSAEVTEVSKKTKSLPSWK